MDKKGLICWGGWDGHEPEACARIFEALLKKEGWEIVFSDSLDSYKDKDLMDSLNLVVPVWTMTEISEDQWTGLRDCVLGGCGIAGWHGGMADSFRQNVDYQFMVGGQWVAHPGGVIDYSVQIQSDDPIVAGYTELSLHSEQYYMHTDPSNEILATTVFKGDQEGMDWIAGTEMPVIWKRRYGKGRVFYSSLGHVASDFDDPAVTDIMLKGMLWAAS